MIIEPEISINGQWPKLEGTQLEELLCEEFWYDQKLEEQANIIHIKVNNKWLRLYFDYGTIFWRNKSKKPEQSKFIQNGIKTEFRVIDLAKLKNIKGEFITKVDPSNITGGSQVLFSFSNGVKIKFKNIDDVTEYET